MLTSQKADNMRDKIVDIMNKDGRSLDLAVLLGLHFKKCKDCKTQYFKDMKVATMKVARHIKTVGE